MNSPEEICSLLKELNIWFDRVDHPAVFTSQEARELVPELNAATVKNLFLRDRKGKKHFLVVVPDSKSADLKKLEESLGSTRLSFASPERLLRLLGITPGSVSLLALVNDPDHQVTLVLDEELRCESTLQFHPLVNTSTVVMKKEGLETFLNSTGHQAIFVSISDQNA